LPFIEKKSIFGVNAALIFFNDEDGKVLNLFRNEKNQRLVPLWRVVDSYPLSVSLNMKPKY